MWHVSFPYRVVWALFGNCIAKGYLDQWVYLLQHFLDAALDTLTKSILSIISDFDKKVIVIDNNEEQSNISLSLKV